MYAGMVELFHTQGVWTASLRLAYQQVEAASFEEAYAGQDAGSARPALLSSTRIGPGDEEQQARVPAPSQRSLQVHLGLCCLPERQSSHLPRLQLRSAAATRCLCLGSCMLGLAGLTQHRCWQELGQRLSEAFSRLVALQLARAKYQQAAAVCQPRDAALLRRLASQLGSLGPAGAAMVDALGGFVGLCQVLDGLLAAGQRPADGKV